MGFEDTFRSLKVKGDMYVGGTLTAAQLTGDIVAPAGSIGATELASDSVTTVKILNANVTAAKLANDSVETLKILNANVTSAKLAVALQPSHVVKYAGTFPTVGGDVTETITVAGVLGTDIVQVSVKTAGAAPAAIVAATAAAGEITVTTDVDPSNDHVLQYVVFRAA